MKFAVVEYNSKTGDVWKHTNEHPNYLADPKKEIDPTSFGCYVSALRGEHVPLLGIITGPVSRVNRITTLYRKASKRLRGSWPTNYSIDYLRQFDVLLVVHQLSDAHEMVALQKRLALLNPHPLIIGVPTQPFGLLKTALEQDTSAAKNFQQFMDLSDVFLTVVKETRQWYQDQTTTPVVYMPQPYPVEYTNQFWVAPADKSPTIFIAGVTQRDNIVKGQKVARELQKLYPSYSIVVPKVDDLTYDASSLKGAKYSVLPFEEWREHLRSLGSFKIVINTDYTYTRGRVQTDCAAVGTPSVGANSDGQVDLFPDLASRPETSVEELVRIGMRLLDDTSYYDSIVTQAQEKLRKYSYLESADRMQLLVRQFGTHTT